MDYRDMNVEYQDNRFQFWLPIAIRITNDAGLRRTTYLTGFPILKGRQK